MTTRPICAICWEGQHPNPGPALPKPKWRDGIKVCGRCKRHTIAGLTEPNPTERSR